MMETFVHTALVGTARQPDLDLATGTAVDDLSTALQGLEPERQLLLTAGLWSVYQEAGRCAEPAPDHAEPAPAETLPTCSAAAALLIDGLFKGEQSQLLPEALQRLLKAGQRLPPEMLPTVLDQRDQEHRQLLLGVIGERGRWLSQFRSNWSWVTELEIAEAKELPSNAETIWQEGNTNKRTELLRKLRSTDPDLARSWLEAVWKQEKAETRTSLLATFEEGLALADETFLEKALDDRGGSVRATAVSLLTNLPGSAFALRQLARADALLGYEAGVLAVTPPKKFDPAWSRDGLQEKPPTKVGNRAWWLTQIISCIPPSHWNERFKLTAAEIITAATANEWSAALLGAWVDATISYHDPDWASALWAWLETQHEHIAEIVDLWNKRPALIGQIRPEAFEEYLSTFLEGTTTLDDSEWVQMLGMLPRPWSARISRAYNQGLRAFIATLPQEGQYNRCYSWAGSLTIGSEALAFETYEAVKQPFSYPESSDWQIRYLEKETQKLHQALDIRQRLLKEIVLDEQ